MSRSCPSCDEQNRDIASYCKKCGTLLNDTQSIDEILSSLVGVDDMQERLSELQNIFEGMQANGSVVSIPYNSIIIGNSGTAKSLIGTLIASLFNKFGLISTAEPVSSDAADILTMGQDDLNVLFKRARGRALLIDNAHKLIERNGEASDAMARIIISMDAHKNDPLLIMAGLPYGLKEFVKKPENKTFTGRFQNIISIPDYTPDQYVAIVSCHLSKQGFSLAEGSSEKMLGRFRYLFKESVKTDSTITAHNGYLALHEAQAYSSSYYSRKGTDMLIHPEDIKGKISEKKNIDEILAGMDRIIGMDTVKEEIRALYAQIQQKKKMKDLGKKADLTMDHYLLMGNPGTGKNTIARLLGDIFAGLGLLEQGHVIEVDRSKLVGKYLGETAILVNEYCDKAIGGILFIDEAYSLAGGSGADYGKEAIDTLLKRMEDDRGKYVVIAAGYQQPIENQFLKVNEGLPSRFRKRFLLPDYTPSELTAIFSVLAKEQGYEVSVETETEVLAFFKDRCSRKDKTFANGREARNLMEEVCRAQSQRISKLLMTGPVDDDAFLRLEPEDVPRGLASSGQKLEDVLAELSELQGLDSVKDSIIRIYNRIQTQKISGEVEPICKHYQFLGNPGTGKTTVARIMARVFFGLGMLPTDKLVEVVRKDLIAGYTGQTAPLVNQKVDEAMGGVLFIDEAYDLNQGPEDKVGHEAINALLTRLDNDRGKFVAIIAGYTRNIEAFISTNPGLKSRFSERIIFEDYTPEELFAAFKAMSARKNISFGQGFDEALTDRLHDLYDTRSREFGNMRTVRQIFEASEENKACRVMDLKAQGADEETLKREVKIFQVEDLDRLITG